MVEMAMASITIFSFLFGIVGFVFKIRFLPRGSR